MKKSVLFLLPALLVSCQSEHEYKDVCYQCFYGNEIELSLETKYELSENRIKMQNDIKDITDRNFYFDYYVLETSEEVDNFISNVDITFKESDINHLSLKDNQTEIVFLAQIPAKYKAFKRNNFQYRKSESEEIFLTSNFYTYSNRKDIAYCYFDVVSSEEIEDSYIYSFVIKIDKSFFEFHKETSIRGILSDSAFKKEDLPNL